MPANAIEFEVRISMAWWWPLYRCGLLTVMGLTGLQPDMDKFAATVRRAMRVRLVPKAKH